MGILDLFRRRAAAPHAEGETRATGTSYTAQMMAARADYITGTSGAGELTATVQGAVSLWEAGFAAADVEGTDLLTRRLRAVLARGLALRGEAVLYITDDALVPVADWDLQTRFGRPTAYRLSLPDVGGGETRTALAAEVVHVVTGADARQPWQGVAPLRRAGLSAGLLQTMESLLAEVYTHAPIGSAVVPFPEAGEADLQDIARGFRGARGRVLVRESVSVQAAGGTQPNTDWRPSHLDPDMQKTDALNTHGQARDAVLMAFGLLPSLVSGNLAGPQTREAQRHLCTYCLQPLADLVAEEMSEKLGQPVRLDVMRPLQAWDAGGRARAAAQVVQLMAMAQEAGVDADKALSLVGWADGQGGD